MDTDDNLFCVYYLCNPNDGICRYVGKTSVKKLEQRLYFHIHYSKKKGHKNKKEAWIKSLLKKKIKPMIKIIETFENERDAFEEEIFYISYFKYIGFNLTNQTEGGDSGPRLPGKLNPMYGVRLTGSANGFFGKTHTKETRARIRKGQHNLMKPVIRMDLNENEIDKFCSIRDAVKKTGAHKEGISRCCSGRILTSLGFKWKYAK